MAMAASLSAHWQVGKSLQECNRHMLEDEFVFNDVTFKLDYKHSKEHEDPIHISALKTLLLARSPVFYAMFAGELAEKGENPVIEVNDIEPQAFREMLRFVYTDDVRLTAGNVMSVLYASKKYIITNLTKRCLQFLEANLSAETALQLLEHNMLFDDTDLKRKVVAKIEEEARAIIPSSDFCKLSKQTLHEVLQLQLHIHKEIDLFEASLRWARKKCQELQKSTKGSNLREMLGENLFLIRFPTMTVDEINETVVPSGVLTANEGYQLLHYTTAKAKKPTNLPFPTEPRCKISAEVFFRPRRLLMSGPYVKFSDVVYASEMQYKITTLICNVSKQLNLQRVFVHGDGIQNLDHKLYVKLKQGKETLLHFDDYHTITHPAGSVPAHFAVDAGENVCVKPGRLQIDIQISLSARKKAACRYTFTASSKQSKLSDDYVNIDFSPVKTNYLLGIEYSRV